MYWSPAQILQVTILEQHGQQPSQEYIREMHMKLNRESHPATGSMSLQAM